MDIFFIICINGYFELKRCTNFQAAVYIPSVIQSSNLLLVPDF